MVTTYPQNVPIEGLSNVDIDFGSSFKFDASIPLDKDGRGTFNMTTQPNTGQPAQPGGATTPTPSSPTTGSPTPTSPAPTSAPTPSNPSPGTSNPAPTSPAGGTTGQ